MKFPSLSWRTSHPYILVDHFDRISFCLYLKNYNFVPRQVGGRVRKPYPFLFSNALLRLYCSESPFSYTNYHVRYIPPSSCFAFNCNFNIVLLEDGFGNVSKWRAPLVERAFKKQNINLKQLVYGKSASTSNTNTNEVKDDS
ncbi:hypothetical protein J1N35_007746 [Gossypium stocksii]|uniref:Uncharacterized protein n=1 Tax=Gossypium stocksii TaxID=47602 RepID=A0A9D3W811_9ROSI|nr:hypothetical protein J1N35_007746 [Gossypium stocksii]